MLPNFLPLTPNRSPCCLGASRLNALRRAVVLVTLPVALLVIFAQRQISGLTAGALKSAFTPIW